MRTRQNQRGSIAVEFALAGVAAIFILVNSVQLAYGMWNYHTLAYATHETSRYLAVKGVGCTKPGNTCSVSVGTIAQKFKTLAIGLPEGQVILTLTTDSGAVTSCNPLSSCYSTATIWPPSSNSDNALTKKITVASQYQFKSALGFFWPGAHVQKFGQVWLPSTSQQTIIF